MKTWLEVERDWLVKKETREKNRCLESECATSKGMLADKLISSF